MDQKRIKISDFVYQRLDLFNYSVNPLKSLHNVEKILCSKEFPSLREAMEAPLRTYSERWTDHRGLEGNTFRSFSKKKNEKKKKTGIELVRKFLDGNMGELKSILILKTHKERLDAKLELAKGCIDATCVEYRHKKSDEHELLMFVKCLDLSLKALSYTEGFLQKKTFLDVPLDKFSLSPFSDKKALEAFKIDTSLKPKKLSMGEITTKEKYNGYQEAIEKFIGNVKKNSKDPKLDKSDFDLVCWNLCHPSWTGSKA